jgi:hypothetical protein
MRPGERITLLRKVGGALHEREWPEIDLILREFGMPTSDFGPNDRYAYVMEQASQGSDEALIELDRYVQGESAANPSPPSDAGGPWEAGAFRLFLSHTHHHAAFAGRLREVLMRWGVDLFVAHDRIEPTAEWQGTIESALRTSFALAALLTPEFVASAWCDQEVGLALGRGQVIVPIMNPAQPHGFIAKFQGLRVGANDTPATVAQRLYDLLRTHQLTREQMAPAVVRRYARSSSYNVVRENFQLLEQIPDELWTETMADEVRSAPEGNGQVARTSVVIRGNRHPVPDVAEGLLGRVGFPPEPEPDDDDIPF